jgi:hypothetical protein
MLAAGSQLEDAMLAAQNPIREEFPFAGRPANILVFVTISTVVYAAYIWKFVRLLRRRFFQGQNLELFQIINSFGSIN